MSDDIRDYDERMGEASDIEAEKYRQEGRDEVLLQIAEGEEPIIGDDNEWPRQCALCKGAGMFDTHRPDCPWELAQEAVKRKAAR